MHRRPWNAVIGPDEAIHSISRNMRECTEREEIDYQSICEVVLLSAELWRGTSIASNGFLPSCDEANEI